MTIFTLQHLCEIDFMPHGHCYFWKPEIVWSHALSDALIAISYFIIPYGLIKLIRKRPDLKYKNLFLLFGLFIVACGTTHILSIINIWHPLYRLDAVVKIITALASVPTAYILIKLIPEIAKLPSLAIWETTNKHLQEQIQILKEKDKTIEKVQEFEFLADSIPLMIWTANSKGQLDYYNESWFTYTGLNLEETKGWGWQPVLHPDDLKTATESWERSLATGEAYEYEVRYKRASDQTYRWHLCRAVAMKDENGQIIRWFGTSTDIDDLKTAQQFANDAHKKFQTVINHAPVILWAVDTEGVYTYSDGKGLENVNLKPGEIVGRQCRELLKDHRSWMICIDNALAGKEGNDINEFGSAIFETNFIPLRDETDQKIIGMVGISFDITRRRKAETESQFKTRFLTSMSHEIRTPLNAVIGFANVLKKSPLSSEQQEYVQMINQSGELLLKLIGDVLDMSKIEEGKMIIEKESFYFKHSLQSALYPYKFRAQEQGTDFKLVIEEEVPQVVVGDKYRINQVLINLIGNALKFTKKGNIAVLIDLLGTEEKTSVVRFTVADTGIGVPADYQPFIFDSFSQADHTIHKEFGGSGLGLSIVKELVHLMKGQIRVVSPHSYFGFPAGSCFVFELPLEVDSESLSVQPLSAPITAFPHTIRILVAEDNVVNQKLAQIVIRNIGCEADFANNGKECLDMLQKKAYDLVLMDVQMPVMDGLEATQHIRKELNSTVPVIGLSANVYKEDIQKSLEAGMNDHIGKPYGEEQIYNAIKTWVAEPSATLQQPVMQVSNTTYLMSISNDLDDIIPLLEKAHEQSVSYAQQMGQALHIKDWKSIGFYAHGYKSSARIIGATKLQQILDSLEKATKNEDEAEIRRLFSEIEIMCDILEKELREKLQELIARKNSKG